MPTPDPQRIIPAKVDSDNGYPPPDSVFRAMSVVESYHPSEIAMMYQAFTDGIYTLASIDLFVSINHRSAYFHGDHMIRPAGAPVADVYYCRTCQTVHDRSIWEYKALAFTGTPLVPSDLV